MRPFFAVASQLARQVGESPVERSTVFFVDGDRDAGVGEAHRDAAAHRAEAEHRRLADGPRRRAFGHIGDLGRGALRKEGVAQRLRLRRLHQFDEEAALAREAFVERHDDGGLDRVDAAAGRRQSTRLLGDFGARRAEQGLDADAGRQRSRHVAQARMGAAPRHFGRKLQYAIERVARYDAFDQAGSPEPRSR